MTWIWTQTESDPRVWEYAHEGRTFTVTEKDARWYNGKRYSVFALDGADVEYTTLASAMRAASRSINLKYVSHTWTHGSGIT